MWNSCETSFRYAKFAHPPFLFLTADDKNFENASTPLA